MRVARAAGIVVGLALARPPAVAAQPADDVPPRAWVVTTRHLHAECLRLALPGLALTIRVQGKVGTVVIQVPPQRCVGAVDALLGYGIADVVIDGQPHALLDVRPQCPPDPSNLQRRHLAGAAEEAARARADAAAHARHAGIAGNLHGERRALYWTAPDGWYLAGSAAPTLDGAVLARARLWFRVEDATLEDLVDGYCPIETPRVTRYVRYRFAGDDVVDRRVRTVCAAFEPARLR